MEHNLKCLSLIKELNKLNNLILCESIYDNKIKPIRQKIAAIAETLPTSDFNFTKQNLGVYKWVEMPTFNAPHPYLEDKIQEYKYLGLTNNERFEPIVLLSPTEDHTEYMIGWINTRIVNDDHRTLPIWEKCLEILKYNLNMTDDDINKLQARRNQKQLKIKEKEQKEKDRISKLKPFDKFLKNLADKYGHGYVAQDVWGYAYVYKKEPKFIPTKDGWNDEDYEPGYWKGERISPDIEEELNDAYSAQYQKPNPRNDKAIWKI